MCSARCSVHQLCDLYVPVLFMTVRLRVISQPSIHGEPHRQHLKGIDLALPERRPCCPRSLRWRSASKPEGFDVPTSRHVQAAHGVHRKLHRVFITVISEPAQRADSIGAQCACPIAPLHIAAVTMVELDVTTAVQAIESLATVTCRPVRAGIDLAPLVAKCWASRNPRVPKETATSPECGEGNLRR